MTQDPFDEPRRRIEEARRRFEDEIRRARGEFERVARSMKVELERAREEILGSVAASWADLLRSAAEQRRRPRHDVQRVRERPGGPRPSTAGGKGVRRRRRKPKDPGAPQPAPVVPIRPSLLSGGAQVPIDE